MEESSIFTKIIKGEVPSEFIYQDEICVVILTIEPLSEGHMLVIPRTQIDDLWELDSATYHHMWDVAKAMTDRLNKAYDYERIGAVVEGFAVPHAHIHVFGYEQPLEPTIIKHAQRKEFASPEELREIADRLRSA